MKSLNRTEHLREKHWSNAQRFAEDPVPALDLLPFESGDLAERWAELAIRIPPWKRVLDVSLVLLSLPVVLPVTLLISIGIKIVSPGPVLYRQERVGFLGRRFKCWKFRSMKTGADTAAHKDHTTHLMRSDKPWAKLDKKDPRVIPLGALLRATGLDELPQLINVLHGEMSWVGPRPCTPYEYADYLPWHKERLEGLPGLTGLWQVTGKGKTTFEQMVNLDIRYVRNISFWLDLKIMFKTIPTLLGQVVALARKPRGLPAAPTHHQEPVRTRRTV